MHTWVFSVGVIQEIRINCYRSSPSNMIQGESPPRTRLSSNLVAEMYRIAIRLRNENSPQGATAILDV